ncbi:MAG: MerR family transcriptional regulator [Tyzzerella sp.]|nr:MerR family transcriptional regulator [Tyzzerella sp.]
MKINEVEALVNITKKNIRFYEEQGLLSPQRNTENGYRNYSEEDVQVLRQIKLLRKLGVPIEEIRHMLTGVHTVGDGMRRHLISLEREKQNLEHSIAFCRNLKTMDISISTLETEQILGDMEELEKSGTTFKNKQLSDIRIRYVAPTVITLLMLALISAFIVLIVWGYLSSPADAPPLWFLWICIGICLAMGAGVVLALIQRIKEIGKGEIDDARHY